MSSTKVRYLNAERLAGLEKKTYHNIQTGGYLNSGF